VERFGEAASELNLPEEDGSKFHIRYATPSDNILLAEVGAETFYDTFAAENTPENMAAYLAKSFSPEQQDLELADPASQFLLAEADGLLAGYARLKFGEAPGAIPGTRPMEIARLYARKPWIGKGIGARLMRECLAEAEHAGCDVIWLDVWERNLRAIAFYRKWGFAEVGSQVFQLGDDPQQDLLMARAVR
jgi:diamine N-acetyltransferase